MLSILPFQMKNVSVRKRGTKILNDVSLNIAPDGFTVVMGPNGAGKSTLLRVIHGLEWPKSGNISWNCSEKIARTRQAFVFQTPVMMRRSVLQNISYPLTVRKIKAAVAESKASQWAEDVGLGNIQHLEAGNLSGGERQKLAIARALISEPEVLFLDEPTTNLDGTSTREIESILQSAHANGTRIIMTTHDIGQAKRLATEVVFLNKGNLCEHSSAKQFFESPKGEPAKAYLNGDIVE